MERTPSNKNLSGVVTRWAEALSGKRRFYHVYFVRTIAERRIDQITILLIDCMSSTVSYGAYSQLIDHIDVLLLRVTALHSQSKQVRTIFAVK